MLKFVFTCGDINGIGPEIVIKTLNKITDQNPISKFYFICPSNIIENTFTFVKPAFKYEMVKKLSANLSCQVTIIDQGKAKLNPGYPTRSSGQAAYKSLSESYRLLETGAANAVITAPVSKTAINMAGMNFPGQTEMFADWSGSKNYVMTFLSSKMNAALLTIHNPLKVVPNLLKTKKLENTLNAIISTLKIDLGLKKYKIAVLGLNPHAGERGLIGTEEKDIIQPIIMKFAAKIDIDGPFSPDAFFANRLYKNYNMVVGMYHDQVLIPFKMINFGRGVNYTAGLPIVRTSPDHGVAYDIAGKGIADESSMIRAYKYAGRIVKNRKKSIIAS